MVGQNQLHGRDCYTLKKKKKVPFAWGSVAEKPWAGGGQGKVKDSPGSRALVRKALPCVLNFPWEGTGPGSQSMIFLGLSSDACLVPNQDRVGDGGEEVEEKLRCHMVSRMDP